MISLTLFWLISAIMSASLRRFARSRNNRLPGKFLPKPCARITRKRVLGCFRNSTGPNPHPLRDAGAGLWEELPRTHVFL